MKDILEVHTVWNDYSIKWICFTMMNGKLENLRESSINFIDPKHDPDGILDKLKKEDLYFGDKNFKLKIPQTDNEGKLLFHLFGCGYLKFEEYDFEYHKLKYYIFEELIFKKFYIFRVEQLNLLMEAKK